MKINGGMRGEERNIKVESKVIDSLGKYMDIVSGIALDETRENIDRPNVLWFRGLSHVNHSLLPTMYRSGLEVKRVKDCDYSLMHYAEDARTQHYNAKNFHFFAKEPSSRIEWLEVMQHHGVKTRALDWSESAIHSLMFALEPFFDHLKYKDDTRVKTVPCVWVLEPGKLNKRIFDCIRDNNDLHSKIFNEFKGIADEKEIEKVVKEYGIFESSCETRGTKHLDYIVNLSNINDEILRDRTRIGKLLEKGNVINPYYYMLARIYSDGMIMKETRLPPLAVVHPYHSERIKAQKGVFTIFPFYEREDDEHFKHLGVNLDAMEYNPYARDCLHKIIVSNPQKVAGELMANGINVSWLYPELPIVANEIEYHRIF
jgi:hypothetical protein